MEQLKILLKKHWGYDSFRPLQEEAIKAVMAHRDTVVVLPTGGGKSLCFQIPAMALPGVAVVVSPLISLMKDQVDALVGNGVPAAFINSTQSTADRRSTLERLRQGELKLLYVAPERLTSDGFLDLLKQSSVSFFAIDEAHCISMWGHDFRKDYRELKILRETFPKLGVHGYTATATQQVRTDIAAQLTLREPEFLVGSFDRPNLYYRAEPREGDGWDQIRAVIARHRKESGIIYRISRKDVDTLSAMLVTAGYRALPYHAGMQDDNRKKNQEAFLREDADIIVATVAFGMGIDKSNVRYVLHASAPQSLEHYQQESGRAGRDGLEAECVLLYSGGDFGVWRYLLRELPAEAHTIAVKKLRQMEAYCASTACRHKALVNYFGQEFAGASCSACDVCLEATDTFPDSLVTAQKILSCVRRLEERYGADYTATVLTGSDDPRIEERGHGKLKTYGALSSVTRQQVRTWIEQLVSGEYLERNGEFRVLSVTPKGWKVIRGEEKPSLSIPSERKKSRTRRVRLATDSWEGVDDRLFEALRTLRRDIADSLNVPAFVVLSDATLRDMARRRPSTWDGLLRVSGIGERKRADYGKRFLECITAHCRNNSVATDVDMTNAFLTPPDSEAEPGVTSVAARLAFELFSRGGSLDDIALAIGRARSTTAGYLEQYLTINRITDPAPWVDARTFARIRDAAKEHGTDRLKPLFDSLGGTVDYALIRIGLACLRNVAQAPSPAVSAKQ